MSELQNPNSYLQELIDKVKAKLEGGLSRKEILGQLLPSTDKQFEKLLKREVTYGLTDAQMNSISVLNTILQILFVAIIICTAFITFIQYSNEQFTWLTALFGILFLGIAYSLSKGILLKRGYVYRIFIHIGLLLTFMKIMDLLQGEMLLFNGIFLAIGVAITIVAYITFKKLFPTYKLFGDNCPKLNDKGS